MECIELDVANDDILTHHACVQQIATEVRIVFSCAIGYRKREKNTFNSRCDTNE